MDEIIIADGPSRTGVPGQWRVLLSDTPAADWRGGLLAHAASTPGLAALSITVEGAELLFMSGDTQQEMLRAIRALYRLLWRANGSMLG